MFLSEQSSLTLFIWVTRFARVSREIEGQLQEKAIQRL